jgi:hypothetical protein
MSLVFDVEIILNRGGNVCGLDRFSVEVCSLCQGQYLYNDELKDVYFDPEDMSRHFFKIEGMDLPPCRYCGSLKWQFAEKQPEQATVQAGPWAWVLKSRVFTFDSEG